MPLRLRWLHPTISVAVGSVPGWGLVVENLGGEPIRWTGFSLCAVGSLHRESGEAVIGTGYPLAFPAIAVRQSMGPGELRPVPLALERMTDDDIRHLDADRYEMIVDRCTLPFRVELPGPLHVEFSTSGV